MMKHILAAILLVGFTGVAVAENEKPAPAEKKQTSAQVSQEAKPANAQAKQTQTRQTPFGPVEATPSEPMPAAELSSDPFVSAEAKGEMVVFRRKTPFGAQVWKKKKSELTADEQAILARGPQPQEKPKAAKPKSVKRKPAKTKAADKQ